MKIATVPAYERDRLKALKEYNILDTTAESDFDDIAAIAATVCDCPIALISFIDARRQWFKSHHGIEATAIARDHALNAHAFSSPADVFIINDLSADNRYSDYPLVKGTPNALFYAGFPLVTADGYVLGILSVLDIEPRELASSQIIMLRSLAGQVITLLELRKKNIQLQQKQTELDLAYADINNIAHLASHDLKSPLNNIISLSDLVKTEFGASLGEEGGEYISYLSKAAYYLSDMISGMLSYAHAAVLPIAHKEQVQVDTLISDLLAEQQVPGNTSISYMGEGKTAYIAQEAVKKILQQLLQNAVMYADKDKHIIDISFSENGSEYVFTIKDNGEGISEENISNVFLLFKRFNGREKTADNMGVGMPIAMRLAEKLGGHLAISSQQGIGTTVVFTVPR